MTPLIKFVEKFVSFDNRPDGRSTTMTGVSRGESLLKIEHKNHETEEKSQKRDKIVEKRETLFSRIPASDWNLSFVIYVSLL